MKYFKIALAALLLSSLIILPFWYTHAQRRLNLNFACDHPQDAPFVAFVLDVSDPLDPIDRERAKREIEATVGALPKGTTYVLARLNEQQYYQPFEDLTACVVPELSEDEGALLSQDKRGALERGRSAAMARLEQTLKQMLSGAPLKRSPLMETLIALSKSYAFRNAARVEIYLYSDMEQNTEALSVYRKRPETGTVAPLEEVSLRGARVSVRRIVRRTPLGIVEFSSVQSLWDTWLRKSGAATVTWEK